jgi:uncharacterized protein
MRSGERRHSSAGKRRLPCETAPGPGQKARVPPVRDNRCTLAERTAHSMRTIALLTISNIFMTFAWYGHLKYRDVPLYKVIVISWMIAFFEYCFQVPANRIGSYEFTAPQLKTIQEVITLTVFAVFSVLYLKQPMRWNYVVGFVMIVAAVAVIFKKW